VLPLGDTYVLRGLAERRKPYGPVRLWGSVAFIVANFAGGLALSLFGAINLVWAVVAASVLVAAATLGLARLGPEPAMSHGAQRVGKSLWRMPAFVVVVAAASLIQSSHAVLQGFATLQWTARGLGGPVIGGLWGLGVVAEIALFAAAARVMAAVGAVEMIILGGIGAVVRWGVMAFDPPNAALPLLQCLHALSFGATHLGTMQALTELAPHRSATAQGDFAAVQGITYAAAMALSGLLFEAYGSLAYAAMVAAAALGALAAILGRRRWRAADPS